MELSFYSFFIRTHTANKKFQRVQAKNLYLVFMHVQL